LTPTQAKVLSFLKTYTAEHEGAAPSYSEIAAALGQQSRARISEILDALEDAGKIRRSRAGHEHHQRPRSIEIVRSAEQMADRIIARIEPWITMPPTGLRAAIIEELS
jgi:SOS-response transcriptional repressor LexA